jgi:hypothetical protein
MCSRALVAGARPHQPSLHGLAALEMLFHESSHSPVSDLFQRVRQAASEQKVSVPPRLWHGVLFYTAGELTTRELKAHGIAYTPYAGQGLIQTCAAPVAARRSPNTGRRASRENDRLRTPSPHSSPRSSRFGASSARARPATY